MRYPQNTTASDKVRCRSRFAFWFVFLILHKKRAPAVPMGASSSKPWIGNQQHQEDRSECSPSHDSSMLKDIETARADHHVCPETCGCALTYKNKQEATKDDLIRLERALDERNRDFQVLQDRHKKLRSVFNDLDDDFDRQVKAKALAEKSLAKQKKDLAYYQETYNLLDTTLEKYLVPYAEKNGIVPDVWDRTTYLNVLASLCKGAEDAISLEGQIRSLQKEMLAAVSKVQVIPDEHFAGDFRRIISLVKSFSRTGQVTEHVDVAKALSGVELLQESVSHTRWIDRAKKKLLVEASVWSFLIDTVFCMPFTMFGSQCTELNLLWQKIYGAEHCQLWPTPTTLSETWRYTTMESMLKLADHDLLTTGSVSSAGKPLDEGVIDMRNDAMFNLMTTLGVPGSTSVASQLLNILGLASKLAMDMSLQKCRLQVTYPQVGWEFDENTMKVRPGPDDEDIETGHVAFVVTPGLTKWGDAHGNKFDVRYDIVLASVQLEPFADEEESDMCSV
ncbi:hypothetical protein J1614_009935 [Plenodomus biglobosus]|nr:hypothetical protein J1614_009935 [Plenodomus biglobosus]